MTFARPDPLSALGTPSGTPSWISSARAETLEDATFFSGAALSHLHLVLACEEAPHALLRDRLALRAAEACVAFSGRPERAAELRDAIHLLRPGDLPGPAGETCLAWRRATERPLTVKALVRALPELQGDQIAHWLDAGQGAAVSRAAMVLEAVLSEADVVAEEMVYYHRTPPCPLETCGCVASMDKVTGKLTLHGTFQAPHAIRTVVSLISGIAEHNIPVISPDIGGGFGNGFRRLLGSTGWWLGRRFRFGRRLGGLFRRLRFRALGGSGGLRAGSFLFRFRTDKTAGHRIEHGRGGAFRRRLRLLLGLGCRFLNGG